MKHSELPWSYGGTEYGDYGQKIETIYAVDGLEEVIGENGVYIDDALFIVKACNNHDRLVEALYLITELFAMSQQDKNYDPVISKEIDKAQALLKELK